MEIIHIIVHYPSSRVIIELGGITHMKILVWRIRKMRHLTLQELSEKCNISKTTINNIENGKVSPRLDQLEAIAKALNVRITDLFDSQST